MKMFHRKPSLEVRPTTFVVFLLWLRTLIYGYNNVFFNYGFYWLTLCILENENTHLLFYIIKVLKNITLKASKQFNIVGFMP